jgi:hypothetical protein
MGIDDTDVLATTVPQPTDKNGGVRTELPSVVGFEMTELPLVPTPTHAEPASRRRTRILAAAVGILLLAFVVGVTAIVRNRSGESADAARVVSTGTTTSVAVATTAGSTTSTAPSTSPTTAPSTTAEPSTTTPTTVAPVDPGPSPSGPGPATTAASPSGPSAPSGKAPSGSPTVSTTTTTATTAQPAAPPPVQPPADTTPPTISIGSPTNGKQVSTGASLTANFNCADDGSGVSSCNAKVESAIGGLNPVGNGGALDTSSAGTFTLFVEATDAAGNTAAKQVSYTVAQANQAPTNTCTGTTSLSFTLTTQNQYWISSSCFADPDGDTFTVFSTLPTSGAQVVAYTGNCAAGRWCWLYTPVNTTTCYTDTVSVYAKDPSGATSARSGFSMNVC